MHPFRIAPAGAGVEFAQPFIIWNEELRVAASSFASLHPDATVLVYSSWTTYTRVLDHPTRFGFSPTSAHTMGGEIFFDHMHPTTRMADIIAGDAAQFLLSVPGA